MYSASFDRISEEANGDVCLFLNETNPFSDINVDLFDEISLSDIPVAGVCDYAQLSESAPNCVEPSEFDGYFGPASSFDHPFECDNNRALMNNWPMQIAGHEKKLASIRNPIPLSQSVGVGLPQKTMTISPKVEILYELEESFRPRYKSDYFAQNGKSRKPRYVADRNGNHFITLKVLAGIHGKIRVDWLTIPDKSGDRYSMPYRFQQSNDFAHIPDCNPIHVDINVDKSGKTKLYLVLIKSKQDELKSLQPLKPFHPFQDAFGIPDKTQTEPFHPLTPKKLIEKHRLDQSQLAFTFCRVASDGRTPIPDWNTTVLSTVLTETAPETAKERAIACPRCTHLFHIPINGGNGEQDSIQETASSKRKAYANADEIITKKLNSFQNDSMFFN